MLKFKNADIEKLAKKLVGNSELFGDEVCSIMGQLSELSDTANQFGCKIEGKVSDMWGGVVTVLAIPDHAKHEWVF